MINFKKQKNNKKTEKQYLIAVLTGKSGHAGHFCHPKGTTRGTHLGREEVKNFIKLNINSKYCDIKD